MRKRGKLIVFDAIDGAGKTTQVRLLVRRLRAAGKKVFITDFPQYDRSFFGALVKRYLAGEFGSVAKTNPYLISLLYALDRFEARVLIVRKLHAGCIVISDRYAPANMIHQASKISNARKKRAFLKWLDTLEYRVLGIPRPDAVLFLDVPPSITRTLIRVRGKRDMHETDFRHQQRAYTESRQLVRSQRSWKRILCLEKGALLPPAAIHERVWREVNSITS